MIRKAFLGFAVVAALAMAGCGGTVPGGGVAPDSAFDFVLATPIGGPEYVDVRVDWPNTLGLRSIIVETEYGTNGLTQIVQRPQDSDTTTLRFKGLPDSPATLRFQAFQSLTPGGTPIALEARELLTERGRSRSERWVLGDL